MASGSMRDDAIAAIPRPMSGLTLPIAQKSMKPSWIGTALSQRPIAKSRISNPRPGISKITCCKVRHSIPCRAWFRRSEIIDEAVHPHCRYHAGYHEDQRRRGATQSRNRSFCSQLRAKLAPLSVTPKIRHQGLQSFRLITW